MLARRTGVRLRMRLPLAARVAVVAVAAVVALVLVVGPCVVPHSVRPPATRALQRGSEEMSYGGEMFSPRREMVVSIPDSSPRAIGGHLVGADPGRPGLGAPMIERDPCRGFYAMATAGEPTPDSDVRIECTFYSDLGEVQALAVSHGSIGEAICISPGPSRWHSALLRAFGEGLASPFVRLDSHASGVVPLPVERGGRVRVALMGRDAAEYDGVLSVSSLESRWYGFESFSRGAALFGPLPSGYYFVDGGQLGTAEVYLPLGGEVSVEFDLADSGLSLAARGRVCDEDGVPLDGVHLSVSAAGENRGVVTTDAQGRYVVWSRTGGRPLRVAPIGHGFEPASALVESGGLADFIRTCTPNPCRIVVRAVGSSNGQPVGAADVFVVAPGNLGLYYADYQEEGIACLEYELLGGEEIMIVAPGFKRVALPLECGVAGAVELDVVLERGFLLKLHVECPSHGPVGGAVALVDEVGVGVTGSSGELLIDLGYVPEYISVVVSGVRVAGPLAVGSLEKVDARLVVDTESCVCSDG